MLGRDFADNALRDRRSARRLPAHRLRRPADAQPRHRRATSISSSTAGRCATSCCSARCAAPTRISWRATAIRWWRCSSTSPERGRRQRPSRQGRGALPRRRPGARPDRRRAEPGAGRRRPSRLHHGGRRGALRRSGPARLRTMPACAPAARRRARSPRPRREPALLSGAARSARARATAATRGRSGRRRDAIPLGAARAQLHETYIVAQTADGIVIVDQHAAHERLVYERMKEAMAATGVARQILLMPEVVELEEAAVARLAARAGELAELGPGARGLRHRRGGGARDAGAAGRARCAGPGARSRRRAGRDRRRLVPEGAARGGLRHARLPRQRARRPPAHARRR